VRFPLPPTGPHPTVGKSEAHLTPEEDPWAGGFPELRPRQSGWNRWGRHVVLFALTAISVCLAGAQRSGDVGEGLKLTVALISILLSHEMGHYLACRYYRVDATLPFFIPGLWLPLGGLLGWVALPFVGTFGAVIRIRSPIPNRKALFDIGIAGPLAGFVVCLPVLVLGVLEARWIPLPNGGEGTEYLGFGAPLLFQWIVDLLQGPSPEGMTLAIGSLGLAAWFGLLVTALNMMPVGQLDGGHVTYALVRGRAALISRLGIVACLALLYFHPSWLLWSLLLLLLGRRPHPPTLNDHAPLGWVRVAVGILGFLVFAVSFTPSPFLFTWRSLFGE
jgi:membrane-associated protease RseP (regulator of RpoE activity)